MKMIKLTRIDKSTREKSQAFYNPECIGRVARITGDRCTQVNFTDGSHEFIVQTPAKIFKLIAQAQDMSAPAAGLYDTTYDAQMADFDRMDDDHRAFAEYDKDVLGEGAFGPGKIVPVVDAPVAAPVVIEDLVVGSRVQRPDKVAEATGLVSITIYGTPAELAGIQVGDLVTLSKSTGPLARLKAREVA